MAIDIEDGKFSCAMSDFKHSGGHARNQYRHAYGSLDQTTILGINDGEKNDEWIWIKNAALDASNNVMKELETAIKGN